FLAIVTFCFSMTVGVLWEFFEYYADRTMGLDMQKDRIVQVVNSVDLGEENGAVHQVGGIERTIIESRDDSGSTTRTVIEGGYLDIGVRDTMKDLLVNLIGAVVFSVFGYLYAKYDQQKY